MRWWATRVLVLGTLLGASSCGSSDDGSGAPTGEAGGSSGGGGSGGSGGASGGPCSAGATLEAVTKDAGFARVGSLFGTKLYQPNQADTFDPHPIEVRVTDPSGAPLADCEVSLATPEGSGWVFPQSPKTDAQGRLLARWTAGPDATQEAVASIQLDGGGQSSVTITGKAEPHATRADSVHIDYVVSGTWDAFSVDVTPKTFPTTTYYSAINFPGGYTGIQNRGSSTSPTLADKWVLFSVWDKEGSQGKVPAELVDAAGATCEGFGGEGTGSHCYITYDWKIGDTYRFEIELSHPTCASPYGCTDYTAYFSDVTQGGARIEIATLRYGEDVDPWYASGFIEDWADSPASCLANEARTAEFHAIKQRKGSAWTEIRSAKFDRVLLPSNNEICFNYYYGVQNQRFLWSTGGSELVSAPVLDSDPRPVLSY